MRFKRRTKDAKIALLRGVDLFSACSNTELGKIAAAVDEVDCTEGKTLTREGDTGWECFVIAEGRAKATARGRKLATLEPGSFFGEMSLLDGGRRSATVTAETDMHLLVMTGRAFSTVVEELPPVAHKVLRTLAERLRNAEKRDVQH
jgi:CRP/FNR family transcriptional regulator, cyclic AMP receptor protein